MTTKYEDFLNQFGEPDWLRSMEQLSAEIHEVDRNAAQIWFRFYPLELHRYLENAEDRAKTVQRFVMQGEYELKNQIDSSHKFLYGHRYWKQTKTEIENRAQHFSGGQTGLSDEIKTLAKTVANQLKVDHTLTIGIAAVGLMTLRQVGLENFQKAEGTSAKPKGLLAKSADQIVQERLKDDSQGVFGFLKTVDKKFSVIYDETAPNGKFQIINDEEVASAAARDQSRDWKAMDERCLEGVHRMAEANKAFAHYRW